jgi:hypothetical protein
MLRLPHGMQLTQISDGVRAGAKRIGRKKERDIPVVPRSAAAYSFFQHKIDGNIDLIWHIFLQQSHMSFPLSLAILFSLLDTYSFLMAD